MYFMYKWVSKVVILNHNKCICLLQNLHNEYDKLENSYEQEKLQNKRLESDLAKVVDEMTEVKLTLAQIKEEKEKMAELIEECELESKVSVLCILPSDAYPLLT